MSAQFAPPTRRGQRRSPCPECRHRAVAHRLRAGIQSTGTLRCRWPTRGGQPGRCVCCWSFQGSPLRGGGRPRTADDCAIVVSAVQVGAKAHTGLPRRLSPPAARSPFLLPFPDPIRNFTLRAAHEVKNRSANDAGHPAARRRSGRIGRRPFLRRRATMLPHWAARRRSS